MRCKYYRFICDGEKYLLTYLLITVIKKTYFSDYPFSRNFVSKYSCIIFNDHKLQVISL